MVKAYNYFHKADKIASGSSYFIFTKFVKRVGTVGQIQFCLHHSDNC